ncbi:MAG: VWA domain-containing protein [Acidobacteriota bacterium]
MPYRSTLTILTLASLLLPFSGRAAEQTGFTDVTEVVAVEVPVQVLRDGEPVRGLTADDFEIYDGRRQMPVTGFEVLDLQSAPAEKAGTAAAKPQPLPPAARRNFLLLFDLSFASPKSLVHAREAANTLLGTLHPSDLVGVATYSTTRGPRLALGFTPDRKPVREVLEHLERPEMFDRSADPLRLMIDSVDEFSVDPGSDKGASSTNSRKETDAALLNENLASIKQQLERGTFEQKGADVLTLARGFSEFAHMMAGIEGRKYVVYLSEGFDSSLVLGSSDEGDIEAMSQASTSGEIWKIDSGMRYGNTRASNELERMLEEFRRADCVIQAVDVGGLREGGELGNKAGNGQDSLFMMANGTGGELYRNFNDLSSAMGEVLKRTSVTYVLAFQPEDLKRDGSYHKLRVELKNAPRGTRVVHRSGFYAPKPYTQQNAVEKLLSAGRQVVGGVESGAIRTSILAAPFQIGNPTYVPVLIEVDGSDLLAGTTAGAKLPAEIYVYALEPTGSVRDFFSQTVGLDLAKVAPALKQSGLKFFGHLDLPPGDYSLRVLVRNGATGASALRVVPLQVPELKASGGPVLLPPFFPEPQGKWLVVREAPRQGDRQVPYPFMVGEEPYIPASLPVLAAGEEARMALVGYNLGAGQVRVESKVLTQDGQDLGEADLKVVSREVGGAEAPDRLLTSFKPARLQPGEYLLLVTLTDAKGRSESSSTPFVVRNNRQG